MIKILDENTLIDLCRKKNRHAQRILFEQYFKKMMPVCIRYLKNEEDSLEALNNAFLKIFDRIKQYKAEGSLESWIKRIVINSSIDFARSNKSYRTNFIHTSGFEMYGQPREEDSNDEQANSAWDFNKEEIFEMVACLPPATRVVFNLFVIDNFPHKQICEKLSISEGTSKWHLSNARKLLKEKLNQAVVLKNKNVNHG